MCVCLVSCGDQNCCATSAKNPSGSNCNVTYWEGRNRVPKNRCEDQTQEVFIMDFRHSYVYHIWFIQEYTKVLSQNARVFPGFWRFISLKNPTFHESPVSTPAFAMCYRRAWRAWSVDPNSSALGAGQRRRPQQKLGGNCYHITSATLQGTNIFPTKFTAWVDDIPKFPNFGGILYVFSRSWRVNIRLITSSNFE